MAPQPSLLSLKLNSSLKTFANNSTLDDSGLAPPSPPLSDYFLLSIKDLHNDVFHAFAGLHPRKAYGPDGVPPQKLCVVAQILEQAGHCSQQYYAVLL
ncbi:hypothetical protein E2C01_055744 [Portunus trituberculatus]|uniref:Uncharacterized protein n=1 Tax=Portunus trituberculatus TaxID=210409 RepID=A0A5B7GVU9_PORTR|nr:hypothetical protein [Portunus trituberculatus]